MYHSIVIRRTKKQDDEFVTRMVFRSSDIKDITIEKDAAGIPVKGWLTTDSVTEGDNTAISFTREHNGPELDQLEALAKVLHNTPTYFTDSAGNLFPYSSIMYVNTQTLSLHLTNGVAIKLHPTEEWPHFYDEYRNWMDIYK
ncbi:hypothetical protein [Salmonella phage SE4]|uniref:hypothetical protein n=1 Tax=Salmonella phage SE4 TaxID=2575328 RepID=UPI0011D2E0A8|nr:hypothetical protein HWC20_gp04 [Salmonella phage SE4]QEG07730.1 hypothetical protein [Salmonella phage SE4]